MGCCFGTVFLPLRPRYGLSMFNKQLKLVLIGAKHGNVVNFMQCDNREEWLKKRIS